MAFPALDDGVDPRIHRQTLEGSVAEYLRAAILSGKLGPGDRIQQDDVAQQLGVSRIPVREALRVLQSEGLVELRPHKGAVVVSLRAEDIAEIYDIRAVLEARAAELAAPRLDEPALRRLGEICDEMGEIVRNPKQEDETRWMQLTGEFHSTIFTASGWPRLIALIENQINALQPYWRASFMFMVRIEKEHEEHQEILRAAEARDGRQMADRIAYHLRIGAQELIAFLSAASIGEG